MCLFVRIIINNRVIDYVFEFDISVYLIDWNRMSFDLIIVYYDFIYM